MAKDVVSFPVEKLQPSSSSSVSITDSADLLSHDDELKLKHSKTNFYNATGVAIQFTTVEYESLVQQAPLPSNYAESYIGNILKMIADGFYYIQLMKIKTKASGLMQKGHKQTH